MAECGTCTLCCKLLGVRELRKPEGAWCPHCQGGNGCGIYEARPQSCRDFACLWLQSQDRPGRLRMAPNLRPDRCKVVLGATKDGGRIVAYVDPDRPGAHATGAVAALLNRLVAGGLEVVVVTGNRRSLLTKAGPPG